MWDLFKAELLRFRGWAIVYAFVHLLVLGFLTRVLDLAQQPLMVYRVFGAVYALTGVLLGLYQMGGYRRASVWLNLLHRPLPAWKIAAALVGACAVMLALAVALPILAVAGFQETMTARVVDMRHWMLPLAALLVAGCGYFAGAYGMLAGRRYSACALIFLVLVAIAHATGFGALAVQALALLWLAAMLWWAFKPDLSAPPRSVKGLVATVVPLQVAVYLLVLLLGFGVEMLWIMQGSHPNNMATPPRGGHNETEKMTGRQRMIAGLDASHAPQAALWREQVALSEVHGVDWQIPGVPVRNELTNDAPMEFDDPERRVRWVFSHDRMRYEGYRTSDGRGVGELGVGEANSAFPSPAMAAGGLPGLPEGDGTLVAGNLLYHYAGETRRVIPRIRLPADEVMVGGESVGESIGIISDRALYLFDGGDVVGDDALLVPRQRIGIPGRYGDLYSIDLIELVDGYLVSFTFSAHAHDLLGVPPYQTVLRVDDGGRVETVARRSLSYDYPALYRYKSWWPSPALHALRTVAVDLFASPDPLEATTPPPVPRSMWMLAGSLMLLSLLAAVWLTRRQGLPWPARVGWVLVCGAIGLPALASLWLLYPEREQILARASMRPVAA